MKAFAENERKIYLGCVRSAMSYGSKAWCLKENEIKILRRTKKAMIRIFCGVKLIKKRSS